MKRLIPLLFLTSCGYCARDNTVTGQVKKVLHVTPLFCPEHHIVDLSLGVVRNGVGSVSREDMELVISPEQAVILQLATDKGQLVKLTYDSKRVSICTESHRFVSKVETL